VPFDPWTELFRRSPGLRELYGSSPPSLAAAVGLEGSRLPETIRLYLSVPAPRRPPTWTRKKWDTAEVTLSLRGVRNFERTGAQPSGRVALTLARCEGGVRIEATGEWCGLRLEARSVGVERVEGCRSWEVL
jgi:hypothetical protein